MEDDGVHAAAEILVVERYAGIVGHIEGLATVRILEVVDLFGVVLGQHDGVAWRLHQHDGLLGQRSGFIGRAMELVEALEYIRFGAGAIVEHGVLLGEEVAHLSQKRVGGERLQCVVRQRGGFDMLRPIHDVATQGSEVLSLIQFRIGAGLDPIGFEVREHVLVWLSVSDQFLHQLEGFGHVLAQSADGNVATLIGHIGAEGAGDVKELLLDLRGRLLAGAEVAEIIEGGAEGGVVVATHIEDVHEFKHIRRLVLLVEQRQARLQRSGAHVLFEV